MPIVPGILPFLSTEQIKRFTVLCGAKLSDPLRRQLERFAGDDESVRQLGVEVCTAMCRKLLDHGVPGIHLYCLNRFASCAEILHNLGLTPEERVRESWLVSVQQSPPSSDYPGKKVCAQARSASEGKPRWRFGLVCFSLLPDYYLRWLLAADRAGHAPFPAQFLNKMIDQADQDG